MPHVQRFRIPYVDAKALIEATPEFWEYPMCDRDPLPRWTHSRVTLLGRCRASDVSGWLERRLAGHSRRALPRRSPRQRRASGSRAVAIRAGAPAADRADREDEPRRRAGGRDRRGRGSARRTASPTSTTCCRSSSARRSCAAMLEPRDLRRPRSTRQPARRRDFCAPDRRTRAAPLRRFSPRGRPSSSWGTICRAIALQPSGPTDARWAVPPTIGSIGSWLDHATRFSVRKQANRLDTSRERAPSISNIENDLTWTETRI